LLGSPTINNACLFSVAGLLEMFRGLKFKGKAAAAFGSYGWSGEAVAQLTAGLKSAGFRIVDDGRRALWVPDARELEACREYGRNFIQSL
jgi:flavorubredoxin